MPVNGRRKGHSYERDIANRFKRYFPDAKRHLEYQAEEAKGYDIDNTGRYRIQCKRGRQYAPINKIEEVECDHDTIPLLITRGDKKEDIVCMYLADFMELLGKLE